MSTIRTSTTSTRADPAPWADRIGRGLMVLDALATLVAFAGGIVVMAGAADDRSMVEGWRTFGYLLCAGLWVVIAVRPRRSPGIWELLLLQKILVTIWAFAIFGAPESVQSAFVDLFLVVTTAVAYVLCRAWLGWRDVHVRTAQTSDHHPTHTGCAP